MLYDDDDDMAGILRVKENNNLPFGTFKGYGTLNFSEPLAYAESEVKITSNWIEWRTAQTNSIVLEKAAPIRVVSDFPPSVGAQEILFHSYNKEEITVSLILPLVSSIDDIPLCWWKDQIPFDVTSIGFWLFWIKSGKREGTAIFSKQNLERECLLLPDARQNEEKLRCIPKLSS